MQHIHFMTGSARFARAVLAAVLPAALSVEAARAQLPTIGAPTPLVLNFEPLTTAAGCDDNTISVYGGLTWTGWGAINSPYCGNLGGGLPLNGFWYGATSGVNVGYIQLPPFSDPFGGLSAEIAFGGGTFDLLDAWLTAAWTTGLDVSVLGYNGATLVGTRNFRLDYTAPTLATFDLHGITSARFSTRGGTPRFELGGLGNILVMDDLSVVRRDAAVVPEPATLLLVASGLVVVAVTVRRRR